MNWRKLPALSALLALLSGHELHAQSPDQKAQEAWAVFNSFCLQTLGARDKAVAAIGNGNTISERVPDDVLRRSQDGRTGGVGWAIRTPHGARLRLEYDPLGICAVKVAEADEQTMAGLFAAAIEGAGSPRGGELIRRPDRSSVQSSGVHLTTRGWTVRLPSRDAYDLAITTADRSVGQLQHLMTLSRSR